ncbi:hypothetical protein K474DRAFT_199521 [Panus rudis PR-1116 ss-1]|nr:hypothetical protein K474DRAFT_199521 [Panus rudis PR-1116 ss-1]
MMQVELRIVTEMEQLQVPEQPTVMKEMPSDQIPSSPISSPLSPPSTRIVDVASPSASVVHDAPTITPSEADTSEIAVSASSTASSALLDTPASSDFPPDATRQSSSTEASSAETSPVAINFLARVPSASSLADRPSTPPSPLFYKPDSSLLNDNNEHYAEADESLALDANEAVISEPKLVSPTVAQAKLIPAPRPSPTMRVESTLTANTSSADASPSPAPRPRKPLAPGPSFSYSEQLSLEKETNRKSFHAVVHEKVRQSSPEHSREIPEVPVLKSLDKVEIDSPTFGDLADLLSKAAMLEEQLSGDGPSRKPVPSPLSTNAGTSSVSQPPEPSIPVPETPQTPMRRESLPERREQRRRETTVEVPESVNETDDAVSILEQDLVKQMDIHFTKSWNPTLVSLPSPGNSSLPYLSDTPPQSPHTANSTQDTSSRRDSRTFTPTRMRTVSHNSPSPARILPSRLRTISHHGFSRNSQSNDEIPPTPPPKSPRYAFGRTKGNKPTMPGAYPRESYSSSDDSAVFVAAPPSVGNSSHDHDARSMVGSDASSVRSSSKSWLGSKKEKKSKGDGLSRAGSVMDRLWKRGKNRAGSITVVNTTMVVSLRVTTLSVHLLPRIFRPSLCLLYKVQAHCRQTVCPLKPI